MTSVVGRWRIVETENWYRDALDLVAPAFIEFDEDGLGSYASSRRKDRPTGARSSGTGCRARSSRGRATRKR